MIESFEKGIADRVRSDLDHLTDKGRELDLLSDESLAKRVVQLLQSKLDPLSFEQIAKNTDNISIRDSYVRVSPCPKVLNVMQKYDNLYRLSTLPENYNHRVFDGNNTFKHETTTLRYILNTLRSCKYILESRRVFEIAADYMSAI